ncbi:hypothetical protein FA798_18050 [Escherichia coli]|nr:hypothetical protein [Escherichia coli]
MRPPPGASLLQRLPANPTGSRVIDKNRSGSEGRLIKTVMAAADAAAMMRRLQAKKPRRGGSVSGAKSAYRGLMTGQRKGDREKRL